MSKFVDLTGLRFGKLKVIRRNGRKGGKIAWLCKCDCGNTHTTISNNITSGVTRSCGCLVREKAIETNKTHGMRYTKLYKIWESMKRRCDCPSTERYKNYGGRGISYCSEWIKFEPFMDWAIKNGYKEKMSIERVDVNGNYCPENCKWIPLDDQRNNKTNSSKVEYKGKMITISELSNATEKPYMLLWLRIFRLKWSVEKAAETPVQAKERGIV